MARANSSARACIRRDEARAAVEGQPQLPLGDLSRHNPTAEKREHWPGAFRLVNNAHVVSRASTIAETEVGQINVRPAEIEDESQRRPDPDLLDLRLEQSLRELVVHRIALYDESVVVSPERVRRNVIRRPVGITTRSGGGVSTS
jgi:hypothetical protein